MGGSRVIAIPYNSEIEELNKLFSKINALFLPGGSVDVSKGTTWGDNAMYLFKKAM